MSVNHWQDPNGPRYGNAYEEHSPNVWTESNKTEQQDPVQPSQNAYQYSGTPYGNPPPQNTGAYSHAPVSTPQKQTNRPEYESTEFRAPTQWWFWLRFVTFLASIGHLGFAAGARPFSNQNVPFSSSACFYYLFAVAVISIIHSGYQLLFYCYRVTLKKPKMNRPILFSLDLILAIMWGVGLIVEAVKFKCWWGGRFCHFYNVSLFWGFLAFACYVVATVWDLLGACTRN
ncbi:hypothetical protein G6F56_006326 [Rhizopus delemar]|nr:hypothetical protein G6F56_006326 [Rhizopus delemar]